MDAPSLLMSSAGELADLAWELTCSAGLLVRIGQVVTDRGPERCVAAHGAAGQHALMLVPRSSTHIEVWWAGDAAEPDLVGVAADIPSILELARRTVGTC